MKSPDAGPSRPASPRIVLASASPARLGLLRSVGLEPVVISVDIDETAQPDESASELVLRLARHKCEAGLVRARHQLGADADGSGALDDFIVVIGADTVATVDGEVLGKPRGKADACRSLEKLSGRAHSIHSGVAIAVGQRVVTGLDETKVWFRRLDQTEIDSYVQAGEATGRAGSYGIQGRASLFVERIEGSYSGVVGLPLYLVDRLAKRLGYQILGSTPAQTGSNLAPGGSSSP